MRARAALLTAPALVFAVLAGTCSAQGGPSLAESLLGSMFNVIRDGPQEPPDRGAALLPEYDFIVVGAGTAGCALAARLSEVPGWSVLLLEAGRAENFAMDIPVAANMLQFSDANWKYRTVPSDQACLAMTNRQCNYPRGKVMGGSSVLNYMIFNRGHHRDYDNWERLGNPGWSYREVLPYFKKLEDMLVPELRADSTYHGTGGPVAVSYPPWRTPLAQAFLEGGQQLGHKLVDYNGATQTGYSPLQTSTRNGSRWSSNRAYLRPAMRRPNLHVSKESQVTRVLLDGASPGPREARGVEFVRGPRGAKRRHLVRARREVILSAGAVNSPQLLMLSGIGPRDHLAELGIPLVQDLAVGYNLMDHVSAGALTFIVNQTVSIRTNRVASDRTALIQYFSYHTGPLTIPGGCEALAFYDLADPKNPDGWPSLELLFNAGSVVSDPLFKDSFGLDDQLFRDVFGGILEADTWMPLPMLMRPKSKGRVKLRDRNPLRKPLIYHNYFAFPEDLDVLVDGILESIRLSRTPAFQKYGSRLHDVPIPRCKHLGFGSRAYWRCHVRHFSFTIYHQSGTCKMAPRSDPNAVVDARLRVHGVGRLRVVDASIMPEIPAAHTNAPTYMIAEKAADMIKQDNGVR